MNCKVIIVLAAVCAQSVVLGSYRHGAVAKPVVLESGHLGDTHEVAAARSAHLAAVDGGAHDRGHGGDYGHTRDGQGHDIRYHGPTAIPHVLKSGHIADTHEVAAAKAEHYAVVAEAKAHGGYGYAGDYGYSGSYGGNYGYSYGHGHDLRYHGPTAIPHVLKSGHIADTHEVAAAKTEHYAAVAEAKAHGGYGYSGDYGYGHGSSSYGHGFPHQRYQGALAEPMVLPSGYLADTHEVQAARHRHLEALHSNNYHGHY